LFDVIVSYKNITNIPGMPGNISSKGHFNYNQIESLSMHISDKDSEEGTYVINMDYLEEVFSGEDIEAIYNRLMTLLEDGIKNPTKPLCELEIIPSEENADKLGGIRLC